MSTRLLQPVADTVQAVAFGTDPLTRRILDRRVAMTPEFVRAVIDRSRFTWAGRSPQRSKHSDVRLSDLDFASVFVELARRHAVIEIPEYRNRRPLTRVMGRRRVGAARFGHVCRLIGNKDTFSFCVVVKDQAIAQEQGETEALGLPMTYMVVDIDGTWYEGWHHVRFNTTAPENEFLMHHALLTDGVLHFQYFVHPNRAQAFFGAPYLRLKMLIERLEDEARYCRSEVKRLVSEGVIRDSAPSSPSTTEHSATEKVQAFEVRVRMPPLQGSYEHYALPLEPRERLSAAYARDVYLTRRLIPEVRFVVRADELAYYRYGFETNRRPWWAKSLTIEREVRMPRGRIKWSHIPITTECGVWFRQYERTERVAA